MNSIVIFVTVVIAGCLAAPKPDVAFDHHRILRDWLPYRTVLSHDARYPYSTFDYNDIYPYYRHYPYDHPYYEHPGYVHPQPYFEPAAGRFVYPGLAALPKEEKKEVHMEEEKFVEKNEEKTIEDDMGSEE